MRDLLSKIMTVFPGSFINYKNELILVPRTNLYIALDGVETDIDLKCKLLEWCSRDASTSQPYLQDWRNERYNNDVLQKINKSLDTNFTQEDIELIYVELGNCINHKLTFSFVISDYNMNLLKERNKNETNII